MDQKHYRLKAFDALHQPILLIDQNYKIRDVNSATCNLMNLDRNKIIGQPCFKIIHGTARECWEAEDESCPVKTTFELRKQTRVIHVHKYGNQTAIEEVVSSPLFDDNGDVNYVIEELRDVSELLNLREVVEHLRSEIKTLRGIIPICASCKKIRNDKGYWEQVETYVRNRTEAEFSHSICPDCFQKLYPEITDRMKKIE